MIVLGIETSCDDTGIALYHSEKGLLAHAIYSQAQMHAEYGGVVPELASRDHIRKVLPLVERVLTEAGLNRTAIDGIAYTQGPGLAGALLVGCAVGRSLAWALDIPSVGVHHLEGHLLAPMLEDTPPAFPFTALLVSGGHTLLADVAGLGHYKILGQSVDDAAGEAFDKTAKLLGLGYPGGPAIAKLARQGNEHAFDFPRPMTRRAGLDFSFSGLKTAVLQTWQSIEQTEQAKADVASSFQRAVVDCLVIKCRRTLEQTGSRSLVVAGGVSANVLLRQTLSTLCERLAVDVFYPSFEFCTDNGAMIAYAGCLRLLQGYGDDLSIRARPRWNLEELC